MMPEGRYCAVIYNDGGIPYFLITNDLEEAKRFTNDYYQHYQIQDWQENVTILSSDEEKSDE